MKRQNFFGIAIEPERNYFDINGKRKTSEILNSIIEEKANDKVMELLLFFL